MSSGQFCPRCGDPVTDRSEPLPGDPSGREARLCDACYLEGFELVEAPEELTVAVCKSCGAIKRGEYWVDVDADDYTDVAVDVTTEALGVHHAVDPEAFEWGVRPEQVDQNTVVMHCEFHGVVRDTPVEAARDVTVRFSSGSCDRCGRIAGDYYASIVQIRAADRTPTEAELATAVEIAEEYVAEREATGDRDSFVSKIERGTDGVNVKLSTNRLGRGVANHVQRALGGTVTDSQTLVTEDSDGNEVYRVTFAVRLPPYPAGTVIRPEDDDPVLVQSAHGNLKGVYLTTGERYEASSEEGVAPEATRLGDLDDAEETTLVAVEDEHAVQVLDPKTYETKTIARPDYLDPDADTVRVIRHREGLHVLPDDGGGGGGSQRAA